MRTFLLLLALLLATPAAAHESRPAYLELVETQAGVWDIAWKQPVLGDRAVRLNPRLSNGWLDQKPGAEELTASHYIREWAVRAPATALAGAEVSVDGLESTITDVVVHARTAKGQEFDTVLRPGTPRATIAFGRWNVPAVRAYLGMGLEHILTGADHLLFVAGLLLLVGWGARLLWTVTAFTLGHSLTLALATLGVVHAPVALIEALVALSIVCVARELLVGQADDLARRQPWLVAGLFGLLHGFAFAGALAETGLPEGNIPLALLLFNLGVEIGQVLFIAALLALGLVWRRLAPTRGGDARMVRLACQGMGCYAAFLFCERTIAAFA